MSVDIVLVEDSPEDVELTLRALRRSRVANPVHVLEDGAEALAYLLDPGRARPRLILLDMKLPKVSGIEVLARIKGDDRLRTVPVVVLTSSREAPDVQEAYRLGANSYIVKPVEFEAFAEAVAQVGLYWLLLNEPEG